MSFDISILTLLLSLLLCVESVMFNLPPGLKKCFKEEIHKDVFLSGEYDISEAPEQKTLLMV